MEPIASVSEISKDLSLEWDWEYEEPRVNEDRFMYATFTDYKKILDSKWTKFQEVVPRIYEGNNKKQLMADLERVRWLRNIFAHPIKVQSYLWKNRREEDQIIGIERNLSAYEDYKFLKEFRENTHFTKWRLPF